MTTIVTNEQARALLAEEPKKNKYGAIKVTFAGEVFHSKGELARWQELQLMAHAGEIHQLQRQVPFPITLKGIHICTYVADFTYWERGKFIVEDWKSAPTMTAEYRLKKRLLRADYGIDIRETGRRK
jgi:hypothetical protein